jgi:hypothetical protein
MKQLETVRERERERERESEEKEEIETNRKCLDRVDSDRVCWLICFDSTLRLPDKKSCSVPWKSIASEINLQ